MFHPHGYKPTDYYNEIDADMKREGERKELNQQVQRPASKTLQYSESAQNISPDNNSNHNDESGMTTLSLKEYYDHRTWAHELEE